MSIPFTVDLLASFLAESTYLELSRRLQLTERRIQFRGSQRSSRTTFIRARHIDEPRAALITVPERFHGQRLQHLLTMT